MPIDVNGTAYYTADDIFRDIGVVRQTLWRWRLAGIIPLGRRYRGKRVVFTREEVEMIRNYANRLEPVELPEAVQLRLFNSNSTRPRKTKGTITAKRGSGDAQ